MTQEPTRRAFRAAVQMEIHAVCSSTTRAKATVLDEAFPGYEGMLAALKAAWFAIDPDTHPDQNRMVREAIDAAEGKTDG